MEFYIVDTISSISFGKEPINVVILSDDFCSSSSDTLHSITAELYYPETCFIKQVNLDTFQIWYFKNGEELDFSLHSTFAGYIALLENNIIERNTIYNHISKKHSFAVFVENGTIQFNLNISNSEATAILSEDGLIEFYSSMNIESEQFHLHTLNSTSDSHLPKIFTSTIPKIQMPVINLSALLSQSSSILGSSQNDLTLLSSGSHDLVSNMSSLFAEVSTNISQPKAIAISIEDINMLDNIKNTNDSNTNYSNKFLINLLENKLSTSLKNGSESILLEMFGTGSIIAQGRIFI